MLKKTAPVVAFLLLYLHSAAAADKKPSIAVLDLKLSNVSRDAGMIVRNKIEFSFYNSGKFSILERNRLDILKRENRFTGKNIDSREYALEAGRILPAEYVLMGSITFNGRYYVYINLVDVKSGSIVYSFDKDYEDENMIYAVSENIRRGVEDKIFSSFSEKKKDDDSNQFYLSVHSGYIPPLRKAEFSRGGLIIDAEFGLRNFLLTDMNAGILAGYSHFYTDERTNYLSISPFMATISYTFSFSRIGIIPGFGAGTAFITIDKDEGSRNAFEPCASLFIKGDIFITRNIAVELSSNYYLIYEPAGNIDFLSFSAGIIFYL
jgi:TolB-like protein